MHEDWIDRWLAEDSERVRRFLIKIVATSGLTRKDVDGLLGRRPGYTSAVLTGRVELKYDHVAGILVALGVHPGPFFAVLYPQDRPVGPIEASSDFAQRLVLAGIVPQETPPEPLPPPAPMTRAEMRALIEETVQRALAVQREAAKPKHSSPKRKKALAKPRKR